MRFSYIAFSLFFLGSLLGCTGAYKFKSEEASSQHNFQVFSTGDGTFMVDESTGIAWHYKQVAGKDQFVPVPNVMDSTTASNPAEVWARNGSGTLVCMEHCPK